MRNLIVSALATSALLTGCAVGDSQVKEAIKKNPKIVFDVIEENPEQFMEVVNRTAQKAQQAQYEKQVAAQQKEQENDLKNPKQPTLSEDRRLAGVPNGKIVIVEYADFQCPACHMAYNSLKEFKEKYKDQVQFYYKHMPLDFHKMAYPSAVYFEAVRLQDKEKAARFYTELFENQRELSEDFLKKAAAKVGANMQKLAKDIDSDSVKKTVAADMEEFQKFGFTGTPSIIMNGVAMSGAQSLAALEAMAKKVTAQ
jgi:protein-disulfide isomerase